MGGKGKTMTFKPNLAGKADLNLLDFDRFEYGADFKYDGIRAVVIDSVVLSRSLKPIPNGHVQELFGRPELNGLDGELIVGSETSSTVFRDTSSGVMTRDGKPEVEFFVFDTFKFPQWPYEARIRELSSQACDIDWEIPVRISTALPTESIEDLAAFEKSALELGYEGIMVRRYDRPYKFGRSSNKITDQGLLKLKRLETGEATIIGYECEYENQNAPTRDALGNLKRSHHQANKVPKNTLGKLVVRDLKTNIEFSIGIFRGYTQQDLDLLWAKQDSLIGKIVSYDYFPVGGYDKPRFPVLKGFRDRIDL